MYSILYTMWNTTTLKKTFKLTKLYRELNGKYYKNLLGDCKFEAVLNPGDYKSAAAAIIYHKKRTGGNTATVYFNSRIDWNEETIRRVLIHEMIHYYLFVVTGRSLFLPRAILHLGDAADQHPSPRTHPCLLARQDTALPGGV